MDNVGNEILILQFRVGCELASHHNASVLCRNLAFELCACVSYIHVLCYYTVDARSHHFSPV